MTSPADPFSDTSDHEFSRLLDRFRQETAELERLRERIAAVRGRGVAADGRVVVETTQTGALAGLVIDSRAMRLDSAELAAAILEASAESAGDAQRAVGDLMAPFVTGTVLDHTGPPDARRARGSRP
ncbi:YbaB/EbfC family nucleoid-associated protein [Nonomuraea cavernae]|uniref:YbaB/EbfC family DNA-binding protein n=1 Tax=Nonomuraea cavernae TaxID=2045107 RepID=A0A917YUV1_9ACTN|nr:YbaB/EbfC family nucleoid-associated protein [Nonomuraea cavernae]MCA2190815.1 YbaB/EbfC family nucleoid-associated protein [Nonomuraea cavernae]GGO66982.1 hypothetical protein GCM10012289_22380 [Nonomuraea cavernae]